MFLGKKRAHEKWSALTTFSLHSSMGREYATWWKKYHGGEGWQILSLLSTLMPKDLVGGGFLSPTSQFLKCKSFLHELTSMKDCLCGVGGPGMGCAPLAAAPGP